jgi:3-(3-hydroxy-phenyl)propionate hydroxylase
VDSGRFAEPYWYVDSPLTTPHPRRRFAGRPPRGQAPPPLPGVLVPDAPVTVPDRPDVNRLRHLVRDGVLALTTAGVDGAAVRAALARATAPCDKPSTGPSTGPSTALPIQVYALDALDSSGALGRMWGAGPGEVWLVRPDGHIAAVVDGPEQVGAATRRLLSGGTSSVLERSS